MGDRPRAGGGEGSPSGVPQLNVRETGDPYPLPPKIENHLLRVALEGVTNAMKHAHATKIDVVLNFSPDQVEITITDDGVGFDADRPPAPSSGHFGLFGMRERAEKLAGYLSIKIAPGGGGTEVRLAVPTNPASPSDTPSGPEPVSAR